MVAYTEAESLHCYAVDMVNNMHNDKTNQTADEQTKDKNKTRSLSITIHLGSLPYR